MNELLEMIKEYINTVNQPMSKIEVITTYYIPIVSSIILVITAICGVGKYYIEKNKDFNEKILNGVYSPLYQYIIKQEYFRRGKTDKLPIEKYPIFSVNNKTETYNFFNPKVKNVIEEKIIENRDLLKVKQDLNFGLVPHELLVLLNIYEMEIMENGSTDNGEFNAVERQLRENIIQGYQRYRRKLGISKTKSKLIKFKKNEVIFNLK